MNPIQCLHLPHYELLLHIVTVDSFRNIDQRYHSSHDYEHPTQYNNGGHYNVAYMTPSERSSGRNVPAEHYYYHQPSPYSRTDDRRTNHSREENGSQWDYDDRYHVTKSDTPYTGHNYRY